MQNKEELEKKLKIYFELARNEPPIISAEETGRIIFNLPNSETNKSSWKSYKNWFIAFGLTIMVCALYLCNSSYLITNTTIRKDVEKTAQISNKNPNKQLIKVPNNSVFSELPANLETPNKEEHVIVNANFNTVGKNNKNKSFYFPGNSKIQFEEQGALIEMMIADDITELKIDNKIIEPENYNQYAAIIEKGRQMKDEADKKAEGNNTQDSVEKEKSKQTLNKIISQLEQDKIVEPESHFVFRLTGKKLYIDEFEQNDSLFTKYKNLYESASGNRLNLNSNISIKH